MTITEASQIYNRSRQTIYNLLNRSPKTMDELKAADGSLTEAGEEWLRQNLGDIDRSVQASKDNVKADSKKGVLLAERNRLERQLLSKNEQIKELEEKVNRATNELEKAQEAHRAEVERIKADNAEKLREAREQSEKDIAAIKEAAREELQKTKDEANDRYSSMREAAAALSARLETITAERDFLRQSVVNALPSPDKKWWQFWK